MTRHALIIGAGLAGSLLAVSLAKDGWRVSVHERRSDPRRKGYIGGRSINLAVSARGIAGLASVGLDQEILAGHAIRMPGRMIHAVDGSTVFQPYSKNPGDAINSFSRGGLNLALIEAAAREKNVSLFFDHACEDIDFAAPAASLALPDGSTRHVTADLIIGADGAFSAVRMAMQKTDRFEYSQSYLGHGYKELHIPAVSQSSKATKQHREHTKHEDRAPFAMEPHALHIWPRGSAMMIALPNTDGSFTSTLFWPWEGEHSFESLEGDVRRRQAIDPAAGPTDEDRRRIGSFFTEHYPDAVPLMPTFIDDFFANPTGSLVTVRCSPWQRRGNVVLLGDAAHAIVPFYGQGMNAAFEDVVSLARHLREHTRQPEALLAYESERKPNADAIADMALANFTEMRDKVGSPAFRYRKKLEQAVHEIFEGRFTPQYNLVSFSTVPYTEASRRGRELDSIVDRLLTRVPMDARLDEAAWRDKVGREAQSLAHSSNSGKALPDQHRPMSIHVHETPPVLFDLSPRISARLKVWPGDTPPTREVLCDLDAGGNITLSTLHATVHLGSHADGPNHYGRGAPSIDQMPLDRYIGPCQVLDATTARGSRVRPEHIAGLDQLSTPRVLIRTNTVPDPERWRDDFTGLSVELVDRLAALGVITIGVDTPSVDLFSSKDLEAHHAILRHGIAIIEGLRLGEVPAGPDRIYELIAMPLPLEGFDASPVRAILRAFPSTA